MVGLVVDNFAYHINIYRYYSRLILPVDRAAVNSSNIQ